MDLLTDNERETVKLVGRVYQNIERMCSDSTTRSSDLVEAAAHCHALQQMVMAQAAARAYPDEFRLLGETHDEYICGHVAPYLTCNDTAAVECQRKDGHTGIHKGEADGCTFEWETYD